MRRALSIFLIIILTRMCLAYDFKVGQLCYNISQERPDEVVAVYDESYQKFSKITIPNTVEYKHKTYQVTSIGKSAFKGCTSLLSVHISNGVNLIGKNAFENCSQLSLVSIPSSVVKIEKNAFAFCSNLTSIIIPNSVTSIGRGAFYECKKLSSVRLSNNIRSIEDYTFYKCEELLSIVIPQCVTIIGNYSFYECKNLQSVTIPEGVQIIGNYAFYLCRQVRSVSYPESLTSIGDYAYYESMGWYEGVNIIIPENVTYIGDKSFYNAGVNEVRYPEGLDISKAKFPQWAKLNAYERTPSPLLTIVDGSVVFGDATLNNRIDADEECFIKFQIHNVGKGDAKDCWAEMQISGTSEGINTNMVKLPPIASGQIYEVKIPFRSNMRTQDGQVNISIEVSEPKGFGIAPFVLSVATKAYDAPFVQVVDYNISSVSGKIRKMEPFTLSFNVQNTKYGDAENVNVKLNLPANVFVVDGNANLSFPILKSGEVKKVTVALIANNSYPTTDIPITIDVQEKYGRYAENKQVNIALNQVASSTITIASSEPQQERKEIKLATIGSAVDKNIPVSQQQNKTTFAVIIANENYQQVAKVPFALNDGNIFKQYCEKTLGIPSQNIHFVGDATINNIKQQVNWLSQVMNAYNGKACVIFYYAGHGVPDEKSKTAFLLPIDGNGSDITTGYKLDDLYSILGSIPSQSVTIFLDACFSGSKREEGMLASARGVAIKVNKGQPTGNMVVFSAASGDETAYPNYEEGHGMFTYYLLKKIQETKGDVTYEELGNYIRQNVAQQSIVLNGKSQTPTITASPSVTDWQNWKLK